MEFYSYAEIMEWVDLTHSFHLYTCVLQLSGALFQPAKRLSKIPEVNKYQQKGILH